VNILAPDHLTAHCPSWCVMHSPSDTGWVHYSDIADVIPTAGSPAERRPYEVSIEQLQPTAAPTLEAAAIRLSGAPVGDPMTPAEALQLAGHLVLAALQAVQR